VADQRSDDVSVVGRGATIDGTLTSGGSLEIHGRLTGAITVEGEVSVAPGSEVRADINAHTISLAGRVKGSWPEFQPESARFACRQNASTVCTD